MDWNLQLNSKIFKKNQAKVFKVVIQINISGLLVLMDLNNIAIDFQKLLHSFLQLKTLGIFFITLRIWQERRY